MSTIELTNTQILKKIYILRDVSCLLQIQYPDRDSITKLCNDIKKIIEEYEMESTPLLTKYHMFLLEHKKDKTNNTQIEKDELLKSFQEFIAKQDILNKMNVFFNKIKYITNESSNSQFDMLYKKYNNTLVKIKHSIKKYNICDNCHHSMVVDTINSELICNNCSRVKKISGTLFDENGWRGYEQTKSKRGTYDPSKHCRFWVERIQARETTDIPVKVIDVVKKCIESDNIKDMTKITCDRVRKYLRMTKNSTYNEHIPRIRMLATGISPKLLTDSEVHLISLYFARINKIFEKIKPIKKVNCPYHPYFIYKIIEQIIKKEDDLCRRDNILSCIHLQSRDTLVENDRIWIQICNYIPEFKYKPTDRNYQFL